MRKLGADLRKNRAFQRLLQQIEDRNRQTFTNLQCDVAHKTIGDNHVDAAREKISTFDVAYEVDRAFLQQRVDFAGQHVALDFFLANRKQSNTRAPASERRAVIHFAHHRKLQQMLGPGIHIRSHVQQHGNAAPGVGKGSSQRDAVYGLERPENELRRGHDRTRVSRADHAIGLALVNQACRHVHRAVFLAPKSLRRVIAHGDHLARWNNLNGQVRHRVLGEFCAHRVRLPHKQNTHVEFPCGQHTAFHFRTWCMVPAHGVNGDGDHGICSQNQRNEKA